MISNPLSLTAVVATKELKDFFRDPRSLILSFILPLVLFPLLFWVLTEDSESTVSSHQTYRIGVDPRISPALDICDSERILLSRIDEEYPFEWRNMYDALLIKDSQADMPLIIYDNTNPRSISAYAYLESLNNPNEPSSEVHSLTAEMTDNRGKPLFEPEEAAGKVFLGTILPFIFFVFAITCPMPGAADLSSGEKERGSLEPLLSTAAPRSTIIMGKLLAASFTGICSVASYLAGIYLSCLITPEILGESAMTFPLSPLQILIFVFLLAGMSCLFSALEILAGFFTRSVREAQLLVMPLLTVGMSAVYISQKIDLFNTAWFYIHIPLVNIAFIIRETAMDHIIPLEILTIFLWIFCYLFFISYMAIRMFQNESGILKNSSSKRFLDRFKNRGYS